MRRARTLLLAASFLAAIPLIAVAQDEAKKGRGNQNGGNRGGFGGPGGNFGGPGGGFPGGGFGGRGGWGGRTSIDETPIAELIEYEPVRKDIGMTDEQYEKWKSKREEMQTKIRDETRKMFEQMRNNGGPRPDFNNGMMSRDNMRALSDQMRKQGDAAVNSLLSQKQVVRLQQIALQKQGPPALVREEVAMKVGLLPQQYQKIKLLVEQGKQEFNRINSERREVFGANFRNMQDQDNNARAAMMEKTKQETEKFTKEESTTKSKLNQEIGKVLNASQKASWKRLVGKTFDVSLLEQRLGGPGMGRGGRDGGRPGGEATKGATEKSDTAKSESTGARGANRRPINNDN